MAQYNSESPMFKENLVYRPFAYPEAVDMEAEHRKMAWTEDEVPLGDDVTAWKSGKITFQEKDFVTNTLKMFTTQDVLVGSYYLDKLLPSFKNNDIRCMLVSFTERERVHQKAYALLNDTLGLPESDYHAFLEISTLREKAEFALEASTDTIPGLAQSIAKGVFNEGVSLFSSFVMLLNFQRYGKMRGMCKIVEWSIRDETKHVEGNAWLFRTLCNEHPFIVNDEFKKEIYSMARTIVDLEDAFIDYVYQDYQIEGLTKEDVKKYIRFIADRRLVQLGLKENWNVQENPLPWLDWILNASNHTNFFEGKVSEYEIGGLTSSINWHSGEKSYHVVSRDGCPYCVKAVELLITNGATFTEVKINDVAERNAFYDSIGLEEGARTVPQIWLNDPTREVGEQEIHIGGYSKLVDVIDIIDTSGV